MPLDLNYTGTHSLQLYPLVGDNAILLRGESNGVPRISTMTEAGASISVPSTYGFGEMIELRYSTARVDTQQQGLFLQIDTSVANTSTIRGCEFAARRTAAVSVGMLSGGSFAGYTGNGVNTGTITELNGVNAEAQTDDTFTGTITIMRAGRFKLQTEDGATNTAASFTGGAVVAGTFGITIENEFVTGGKVADAAIGVATTSLGIGYNFLIDSSGTKTTVANTDQVGLFKFLNDAGTAIFCRYDQSAGGLVFATS